MPGIGLHMNEEAYLARTDAIKREANTCDRCQPTLLCSRHALAMIAARRERTAVLMHAPPVAFDESHSDRR
jgi:hypothetical protein